MEASLGNCKDYSLKQYLLFADKLQAKAKVSDIFGFFFHRHSKHMPLLLT